MLNIYFGQLPDLESKKFIYDTAMFFDNSYKESWITSDFGRKIIKDVDKSEVKDGNLIESPVLGGISPKELSGGVKTLLLVANDSSHIFNCSTCGDNCAKWLLEIAEKKKKKHQKVVINLRHIMKFGKAPFSIKILNNGKIVKTMLDLVLEAGLLV